MATTTTFWAPTCVSKSLFQQIHRRTQMPVEDGQQLNATARIVQGAFRFLAAYAAFHTCALMGVGYNLLGAVHSGVSFAITHEQEDKTRALSYVKHTLIETAFALLTFLPFTSLLPAIAAVMVTTQEINSGYTAAQAKLDELIDPLFAGSAPADGGAQPSNFFSSLADRVQSGWRSLTASTAQPNTGRSAGEEAHSAHA